LHGGGPPERRAVLGEKRADGQGRAWLAALAESGVERLPAERRYARREQALRDGIAISNDQWARLRELLA